MVNPEGDTGAGIGIGQVWTNSFPSEGSIGHLVLDDGRFSMVAGHDGMLIGNGRTSVLGKSRLGNLMIRNGTYDLVTGYQGTCIGLGRCIICENGGTELDNLTILGGDFRMQTTGWSAALGVGSVVNARAILHNLVIGDGSFNISCNDRAAAIGTGHCVESGTCHIDNLTILAGDFELDVSHDGAGVGTGMVTDGDNSIGTILIVNGTFRCRGERMGSGIGLGASNGVLSSIDNVTILGGDFVIDTGTGGAAIGAGDLIEGDRSLLGHLGLHGGKFKLSGYSGIGSSSNAFVSSIVIGGSDHVSISCVSIAGPSCLNGPNITIDGSVSIAAGSNQFVKAESLEISSTSSLLVTYRNRSESERISGYAFLHVARFPAIRSDYVDFSVTSVNSSRDFVRFDRSFQLSLATADSFMVKVVENQKYEITMAGVPAQSHTVMLCNGSSEVEVLDSELLCELSAYSTVLYSPPSVFPYNPRRRLFLAMSFMWFWE
jgi:hypothetical protein